MQPPAWHEGPQHGVGGQRCHKVSSSTALCPQLCQQPLLSTVLHLTPPCPSQGRWRAIPGMSYGCHPLIAVLGILCPQLQGLLVLMVEVNGEVMLGEQAQGRSPQDPPCPQTPCLPPWQKGQDAAPGQEAEAGVPRGKCHQAPAKLKPTQEQPPWDNPCPGHGEDEEGHSAAAGTSTKPCGWMLGSSRCPRLAPGEAGGSEGWAGAIFSLP